MNNNIIESFNKLRAYCEAEKYKGWDPYDGLNSKLAHALLPMKHSAILRLCIIQGFKRCPVNLRRLALVPKEYNAKGVGLFLQGYCNLYKIVKSQEAGVEGREARDKRLEDEKEILDKITYLADLLLEMRSDLKFPGEYHGACWGYNFDWQARRLFLFPAYTPTVVATNFCATALMEAYEVLKESSNSSSCSKFFDVALSAAEFVMQDLHRYYPGGDESREAGVKSRGSRGEKFLFSYSKLPGNDTVYNASLLGSRLLSYCYKYTGKEEYLDAAKASVLACIDGQNEDGSWVYGLLPVQSWIDSFHTGYNLDGLVAFYENCVIGSGDERLESRVKGAIDKGVKFYIENHFEKDGTPKYYHNRMYPIDIHCPGQMFVTLSRLHKFEENKALAEKVMQWAIENMQDKKGFFYYQLKQGMSSKISYMRWSNAFMFCAMTYYLMEVQKGR